MRYIPAFRSFLRNPNAGRRRGRLVLLVACVLAGGLVSAGVRAVVHPSSRMLSLLSPAAPGGELHAVRYLPGARHSMDIFLPKPADAAPPVVVFFYGGAWRAGDKEQYRYVGRSLAACGVMAVIPDYRVWPEVKFPGFLEDGAAAVAGAVAQAPQLGGDTRHLFLMGHPAGAHIATMLGLDRTWLGHAGMDPDTELSGVIGLAGVYDFMLVRKPKELEIFAPFGAVTQPLTFADHMAPPMLLMAGRRDSVVDPANTSHLVSHLEAAGGEVRSMLVRKADHADLVKAFAWPRRERAPVLAESCAFIHAMATRGGAARGVVPRGWAPVP